MKAEDIQLLKDTVISGKNVNLRIATEKDAEFILELRLDPVLSRFINKTDPSVEKQRDWLKNTYKKDYDFHFIIEDKNSNPLGTIAVYDIDYSKGVAEWGRWLVKAKSPIYVPIESNLLAINFAFSELKLNKLIGSAYQKNKEVVKFHKNYAAITSQDETTIWFAIEKPNFERVLKIFNTFHSISH
jgi:RimJ/RimL family protein N-acetyltransferase